MKVPTSIALSEDLLVAIDEKVGKDGNRSELIETAVWDFLERTVPEGEASSDLEIINRYADELNREAEDVLEYQVIP